MTTNAAPACRCGLTMRVANMQDAWECRCGLWLDAVELERLAGVPIPNDAYRQGEPWTDPGAGLRVSDAFADVSLGWGILEIDPAKCADKEALQRACADAFECSGLRLMGRPKRTKDIQPSLGNVLILEDGEQLKRHQVYALVPVGQEADATRGIVQFIIDKHGPGKLWTFGEVPIGSLKKRAQHGHRGTELGGVLHVVMGCYYFHKPDAPKETTTP